MSRKLGGLALALTTGWTIACGGDSAGIATDTEEGSGTVSASSGDGPDAEGDDGSAGDADSTGGAACGNGVIEDGEVCDDGPDNGMLGRCRAECQGLAECGDGEVQRDGGEVCDDGPANGAYGSCARDCSGLGARCGDGIVQEDEQEACDDSNAIDGDGCNEGCALGGQEMASWTWGLTTESERARAVGVLADGRFYAAGSATDEGMPMLAAFDRDGGDPFFEYNPYHTGGGFASASTMPDGRVLATGDGMNGVSQQNAVRVWIDLDTGEDTPSHILDAGYNVRSAPLSRGGHVLCNNAVFLGLRYFAAGDPIEPVWETADTDCHQITASDTRVVRARIDSPVPGAFQIVLTSFDHDGMLDWETSFNQGSGSQDVGGVAIDGAGNVLVAGSFEPRENPVLELRPMLRKYDADGELVWSVNALFQTVSEWTDVTVDALDNVVVVGYHRITIEHRGDEIEVERPVVRKYDAAGELVWSWQDDDASMPHRGELSSVVIAPSGSSILAAGYRRVLDDDDDDVLFVRLSP